VDDEVGEDAAHHTVAKAMDFGGGKMDITIGMLQSNHTGQ